MKTIALLLTIMIPILPARLGAAAGGDESALLEKALANGRAANEGFRRCRLYVDGWLALADPGTGLIPRNTRDAYWNARDAAADNYPFMVLTAAVTDRPLFEGRMRAMLETEIRLTSRVGVMPDTYDFAKKGFASDEPDLGSILFGSSEYIKDGLLPLTEWLGPSPWCDRMLSILDDMWKHAPIDTPHGKIVSDNVEVNGEMLQTLSRVHWMTGEAKHLDRAVRLGDYYLLGGHHPTRDMTTLRLRDHGCEIVSGLCELYAAVHFARPEKKKEYEKPVHEMLDRILEAGRNGHGLFYNSFNPRTGEPGKGVADTWGYTLNGFYTVFMVDGTEAYREAVRTALACLKEHYSGYRWEGDSSDGYADSIESALNLYNREPVASAAEWIDSEMRVMWGKQKQSGVIEGWHGDGNFARTTIMYCLWKTAGVTVRPWRADVVFGAAEEREGIYLVIEAEKDWSGKLLFDAPRHRTIMKLPVDWPRINQFPEWFFVEAEGRYALRELSGDDAGRTITGRQLHEGVAVSLEGGERRAFRLQRTSEK